MREIKFRAIPIDEFDAVVGQDCGHGDGTFIFGWGAQENPDGTALFMRDDNDGILVKANTVGQYTGMKDCAGKEIYEDDIVRTDDEYIAVITWDEDEYKFTVGTEEYFCDLGEYYPRDIEVIGNIYDNPECWEVMRNE